MDKKRNFTYKNTQAKNGEFSPKIPKSTAERIARYCKDTNQNKTTFVVQCVNERLDVLELEFLNARTKEELVEMLLNR